MFLAHNMTLCVTNDKYGNIEQHETTKSFTDSQKLSDRKKFFERLNGDKISANLPLS